MANQKSNGAYKTVERIEVYLWDKFVGAVALDPNLQYYVFAYDRKFGKSGIEVAPLHMPLRADEAPYVFADLPEETYRRLPAMLADALPDDFGNALIDRYLADKGIPKNRITVLDRLAYMGKRAMGALEFKPTRGPRTVKPTALDLNELVGEARKAVAGIITGDDEAEAALRSIIEVGTSAGGARAKAVIGLNEQTHEIRSGQVELPPGFEYWLLKFDGMGVDRELGSSQHYGRIEYAYYLMARAAGIEMSPSRLLEENGRAHFITRRFDREPGNVKHHMQTLCAMNHIDFRKKSTNSYEQLFMTLDALGLGYAAMAETFRRMVFNVLSRNCDDHSKNFSFLLKQQGGWQLAPAYDISFAHNPNGQWTNQHLMSVNGKYKDISRADLQAVAKRFGIGEEKWIIENVLQAIAGWKSFADEAGLPENEVLRIQQLHLKI